MMITFLVVVAVLATATGFHTGSTSTRMTSSLRMSSPPAKWGGTKLTLPKDGEKTGAKFNYDPSNYKDSNSANYRRLGDQLAAVKAEEEKMARERDEIIRKEKMAEMFLKQENSTFWDTAGDKIVADASDFYVSPAVLQIIDDLDNQLVGLKPVSYR